MDNDESIVLYRWIGDRFAPDSPGSRRAIATMGPALAPLVEPGDRVLDLCCGAGAWSFFFDELSADVTGTDVAAHMIDRARRESERRDSTATFHVGDVLTRDLGEERYDLALLMGNTVADLPPSGLSRLAAGVHRALRPGGRFAVHYLDGVAYLDEERSQGSGVDAEGPPRITWCFREYRPDDGAWVVTYTNEETGERYEYTSYVYPTPLLRLLLDPFFTIDQIRPVGEARFLDIFTKRSGSRSA